MNGTEPFRIRSKCDQFIYFTIDLVWLGEQLQSARTRESKRKCIYIERWIEWSSVAGKRKPKSIRRPCIAIYVIRWRFYGRCSEWVLGIHVRLTLKSCVPVIQKKKCSTAGYFQTDRYIQNMSRIARHMKSVMEEENSTMRLHEIRPYQYTQNCHKMLVITPKNYPA